MDLEAYVVLATRPVFLPQPGFFSRRINVLAPKPGFSGPCCPRSLSPRAPSCPHRTVAAEVRKQVSRERSGSPHSSRRCSSSLGVSVREVPPLPRPRPLVEVGFPCAWALSRPPPPPH